MFFDSIYLDLFTGKLVQLILQYNYCGFPLAPQEVRQIVGEYCEKKKIKQVKLDDGSIGKGWMRYFMKRYN